MYSNRKNESIDARLDRLLKKTSELKKHYSKNTDAGNNEINDGLYLNKNSHIGKKEDVNSLQDIGPQNDVREKYDINKTTNNNRNSSQNTVTNVVSVGLTPHDFNLKLGEEFLGLSFVSIQNSKSPFTTNIEVIPYGILMATNQRIIFLCDHQGRLDKSKTPEHSDEIFSDHVVHDPFGKMDFYTPNYGYTRGPKFHGFDGPLPDWVIRDMSFTIPIKNIEIQYVTTGPVVLTNFKKNFIRLIIKGDDGNIVDYISILFLNPYLVQETNNFIAISDPLKSISVPVTRKRWNDNEDELPPI